jgi:hypothetical protein
MVSGIISYLYSAESLHSLKKPGELAPKNNAFSQIIPDTVSVAHKMIPDTISSFGYSPQPCTGRRLQNHS